MNKLLKLSILLSASLCLAASLSSCDKPNLQHGIIEQLDQGLVYVPLRFDFSLADPRPDYLDSAQTIKITILRRGSQAPVEDSFELSVNENTSAFSRTLDKVPAGQLEITLEILDDKDKPVRAALKASFTLDKAEKDAVLIRLDEKPSILPPSSIQGSESSVLRGQRLSLLAEIQTLSGQESLLLRQLTAVASSQAAEDKILKEQYRAELQVLQNKLRQKELERDELELQLARLDALSLSQSSGSAQESLNQVLTEIKTVNADLDQLLLQRKQLSSEVSTLVSGSNTERLNEIQGEISTLDNQIDVKITRLEQLAADLKKLEGTITSQNQALSSAERLQAQQAELQTVEEQIKALDLEIPQLKVRIEVLISKTDFQSIQRREALEADLSSKEKDLANLKLRQSGLHSSIDKLSAEIEASADASDKSD